MSLSAPTTITNAATTLGNLILVTPENVVGYAPQNPKGGSATYLAPSILFHYEGENTTTLESDITDHWVENNSAIQDQIALKPIVITTQGFIGELNDLPPNKFFAAAQFAAQKLTTLSAYTPQLSATALNAYNEAVFFYNTAQNVANNAIAAWNSVSGQGGADVIDSNGIVGGFTPGQLNTLLNSKTQTKQQQYFTQFFGYWNSRTLFTLQTPWAIFKNMAIKSLKAIQSADTRVITDFEVSFKQIRYAQTLVQEDPESLQGRLRQMAAGTRELGTNSVSGSPTSLGVAFASIGQV